MSERLTEPVKFLLVDDREENLVALEALLRRDDLVLLKAHSGEEALEILLQNDVALALLDVQMPGMDGFELAELMRGRERTKHVPIIFVTGDPSLQKRVFQGYDAGAVDFLIKPVEPGILRHKTATFFSLFQQRQQLAETLRLNETFVAAVGHDLKNPLNAIVMATGVLAQISDDPKVLSVVERIRSSGMRMSRIIDDLFDLSRARVGSGGIPIMRAKANALEIAQHALVELDGLLDGRSIVLEHEGNLEGSWDADRISQVMCNLLGNSIRHGEPTTPISLSLLGGNNEITIRVKNRGSIPPNVLPHIFDPFRSAENKPNRQGLGLGLYIVDQIVLAHGGSIDVTSTPEDGTTFLVHLPR
jgi:two-component system sensor histidine kinase/response regulator